VSSSLTSSFDAALESDLAALRAADLERALRVVRRVRGAVIEIDGRAAVDFASNDYLGLATDARIAAAFARVVRAQGVGAAASRLIAGNHPEHEALEFRLAEFFGAESALSFSSGYAANIGAIPALVGRGDVIFSDELNHASLIDGCRLSRADVYVYPHANADVLRSLLAVHRATSRRALIVTDGMFSMDGDFAPLRAIVSLAREYDAWTYVDDAHGAGVLGDTGRGTPEALGVDGEIDVLVGTLGKAFGCAGAYAVGRTALRDLLINRARSFVFSTGALPAQAAAARTAVEIVRAEPEHRLRLRRNARHLRDVLRERHLPDVGEVTAHIVPIHVGGAAATIKLGASLVERGFLVGAVRPPTVPDGTSRLRVSVSAAHSADDVERFAESLTRAMRE
jgi:8-amino-7-oxononanoate synthase